MLAELVTAFIKAGPWGLTCAMLILAVVAVFGFWMKERANLLKEVRRSAVQLHASTDVMEELNDGRDALVQAVKECVRLCQESLGRNERIVSLVSDMSHKMDLIEARRVGQLQPKAGTP